MTALTMPTMMYKTVSCDEEACSPGGDHEPAPDCVAACAAIDVCDLLYVVDISEDEGELCEMFCSGSLLAGGEVQEMAQQNIDCVNDWADSEALCDAEALGACFPDAAGEPACANLCAELYGGDEPCPEDSGLVALWPTPADCAAACAEAPVTLAWWGCTVVSGCGPAVADCADVPTESDADCEASCAALEEACSAPFGLPTDACAQFCTGVKTQLDAPPPEIPPADCVAALDACPVDGGSQLGVVYGCASGEPEQPAFSCVTACSILVDQLEQNPDCVGGELVQAWPTIEACAADCGDSDPYAFLGCGFSAGCGSPQPCIDDLPEASDPGCVDACDAYADGCEGAELSFDADGCAGFCTGFLAYSGSLPGSPTAGSCIEKYPVCAGPIGQLSLVNICEAPAPELCAQPCADVAECAWWDWNYEIRCKFGCAAAIEDPQAAAAIEGCLDAASSCEDGIECLPLSGAANVCGGMCDKQSQCTGTEDGSCQETCEDAIIADVSFASEVACVTTGDCEADCAGLPDEDPLPECVTACQAADVCTWLPDQTCEYVCSGTLVAAGVGGEEMASCTVNQLREACEAPNAYACVLGPPE